MKAVILAGGFGTRFGEETKNKPKPMIEIGGKPILWHIMKIYSTYGVNDFIICCGYKSDAIRNYFLNSFNLSDVNESQNHIKFTINFESQLWNVTLVNTGLNTMTGGRIKLIEKYVDHEAFHLTYGDTLSNVNITELLKFHKKKGGMCTVTACKPQEKYGILIINDNDRVVEFKEKPVSNNWVNGGYFILEHTIFELIDNDKTVWEKKPLETLVHKNQFFAYKHEGYYQPMDTINEKNKLNDLWESGNAPWKIW